MQKRLLAVSCILLVALLAALSYMHFCGPRPGRHYMRGAYDSTRAGEVLSREAVYSDSASSPLARHLAANLLRRKMPVHIDRTGRCAGIAGWYDAINREVARLADPLERRFRAVRPLFLFREPDGRCFSYTVQYEVPLPVPMQWRRRLLSSVPLRLSAIHPREDARLLRPLR